jgi:hypothetical protein
MNDKTLRDILKQLPVPPPSDAAREKALARAAVAYVNRPTVSQVPDEAEGNHWVWEIFFGAKGLGSACVLVLALVCFLTPRRWREKISPNSEVAGGELTETARHASGDDRLDAKLLGEMESLFRGQLDAVISRGNEVSLDLDPGLSTDAAPSSQPLAVILRRGKQIVRVLGFSGREVCVQLDGRKECFEVLVNGNGKVFLVGHDFVWSDDNPKPVAGFQVEAHPLYL